MAVSTSSGSGSPPLHSSLRKQRFFWLIPVYALAFLLSYFLAFVLRFDGLPPPPFLHLIQITVPLVLLIKIPAFWCQGIFHGWWRFVTFSDLVGLAKASLLSMVVLICLDFFLLPLHQIPRSVLIIDCCLTIVFVGGLRSLWRFRSEHVLPRFSRTDQQRVFVIGAQQGGERLVRELRSGHAMPYRVVGFLDDDPSHRGSRLAGIPFLGTTDEILILAERYSVDHLLIISESVRGSKLRRLIDQCREGNIHIKMIPSVTEMLGGRFQMRIRDVDINDLLRRDPVQLNDEALDRLLSQRRVLVTGAGGSIGSEICRQVACRQPALLVLAERAENSLFRINHELQNSGLDVKVAPHIADVCDGRQMRTLFERYQPEIVIHAAAHKHVPLMEQNPGRAIANNLLGTKEVADLAVEFGVERFVLISTDKAVTPTSVMGATKQLAERYVHALAERTNSQVLVSVRFGNVLASDGSVVPTFQEQIRRGGPLTITHRDMQRYFMTIPEASQLVLQAAAIGRGGEIFVLDMGKPVRIMDLAQDMIRLSGHTCDEIEIEIRGIRPGEKLNEVLHASDEQLLDTEHPRIRACYHRHYPLAEVQQTINELSRLVYSSAEEIRAALIKVIPDYLEAQGQESTKGEESAQGQESKSRLPTGPTPEPSLADPHPVSNDSVAIKHVAT